MNELITEIREALNLTKTQLAAAIECSPAQVTRLEEGTRTPNAAIMARLWALCPPELRQRLADEVLRAAGVPVVYREVTQ